MTPFHPRLLSLPLLLLNMGMAQAENHYVFDPLVANWFSTEQPLTKASSSNILQVAPGITNSISVNAVGNTAHFPKPLAGDWAGAIWQAPEGELITEVRMAGDFRRETLEYEDFGAALYGGKAGSTGEDEELLSSAGGTERDTGYAQWNEAIKKMTYDWSIPIDPEKGITRLQIRPWQALEGGRTIQAGSPPRGYSGNVTTLEITTVTTTAGGKAETTRHEKQLTLGDDSVRLTLSAHGEVVALEDLETGSSLFTAGSSPFAWTLAWRIIPRGGEDISISEGFESADAGEKKPTEEAMGTLNNRRYGAPEVVQEKDSIRYTWKAPKWPTVVGRVIFNPSIRQFEFTATVENHSGFIIDRISFPAKASFPALAENTAIVAADNAYDTSLKPLNTLKPFVTMYPGYMFMQMAGFRIGNAALLVYTNDDKAHVKWMNFSREGNSVGFDLSQQIRLKPGATWEPPFSVVWKVIPNGTYHEMAAAYAEWGRKQWWAQETLREKMAKRPALKRYFEGGLVRLNAGPPVCDVSSFRQSEDTRWHYIENNKYSQYEPYYDNIIESFGAYEKAYDFKPGYWHGVWSGQQFDSIFPDYFPVAPYMGDFEKFKADLIRHGYPMLYHTNPAQWAETAPSAQEKKYIALTDKGTPYRIWFVWSKKWSLLTSPAVSLERELQTLQRIRDEEGINGIYMDVIGHSFATDENPASPFHGQPNDYQLQKIEAFKGFRKAITGPLMTEARNEIELAYMDMGTGGNGRPTEDEVPLWELVYGDFAANSTYAARDKQLRYYTWMIGGVQATPWDWPKHDGTHIDIYLTALQQKAVSAMVPERMERFERLGDARLSLWASGLVLWNKAGKGATPFHHTGATTLGELEVKALQPGGIVIWNKANEFTVDGAAEVKLGGKTVFQCDAAAPLSVNRAAGRWVVHNENAQPVSATIRAVAAECDPQVWTGKLVKSGEAITVEPQRADGVLSLKVEIPAGECLVLGRNTTGAEGATTAKTQLSQPSER